MNTSIIEQRVGAVQNTLINAYHAGVDASSATKGNEREFFINAVLASFFPQPYRFGTGDILDKNETRTGQLDVVMEYPLVPSIPAFGSDSPRLYISSSVAAVIEVKSDLGNQWNAVEATGKKVKALERNISFAGMSRPMTKEIPYLAVGFEGWKNRDTLLEKVNSSSVDAAMVINHNCFANKEITNTKPRIEEYGSSDKDIALWGFVKFLYTVIGSGSMLAFDIYNDF